MFPEDEGEFKRVEARFGWVVLGFEVLTPVVMKSSISWDATSRS
jgi:hypothetical protein